MTVPDGGRDDRRGFFRVVLGGSHEGRFAPRYRLNELPALPASQLAELIPAVLPGIEIIQNGDQALARVPGQLNPLFLFQVSRLALCIFNRFDGRNSLAAVTAAVSDESGKDREEVFAEVRAMFLGLVALRVCAPGNLPQPPGSRSEPEQMP
jgi:hypothetical protein